MTTKSELRERALLLRHRLKPDELAELSSRVAENLFALPEFEEAKTLATYVAKENEIQTASIIERALRMGKRVIVPRTEPSTKLLPFFEIAGIGELSLGSFGVLEPRARSGPGSVPVPLSDSDAVLVPLLAWDGQGNRIGYGRGYFDSTLPLRESSAAIGLALEAQRVAHIPATDSDVPLDVIVTEDRVLRLSRRKRGDGGRH